MKAAAISDLMNMCVVNALGYKSKISSKTVDDAIDGIISFVHSEIDISSLSDEHKDIEKNSYRHFAQSLGEILKKNLRASQQLIKKKVK